MSATIRKYALTAVLLSVGLPYQALSQTPTKNPPTAAPAQQTDQKKAEAPKSEPKKEEPKKDDDTVDYEKFIKDLKRVDGPMPLYQKGKNVYLELPEDKIGKIFLIQAAFDSGLDSMFMHAGMPLGGQAVDAFRFARNDDSVWLERPNINNRWSDDSTFRVGAERAFPDAMLNSFRVEQHNTEKKLLLVNVTSLFYGDVFHLSEMIQGGLGGPYQLDPTRSAPDTLKGFPDDTVVTMKLHYASPRGGDANPLLALLGAQNTLEDDRSAPVKVVYTMWWRKDSNYVPRVADSRIGYFTTDFFSVDRFLNQDKDVHYINRFDLEKKDPKAAVSEPVKPIVWTIDPSIPEKYRGAIKEGVLRWNKAFAEIGFKDAIQVQDAPKDDKSYDHADGRYNVIRLMVGPSAPFAAISLLRTDPFTGQILNASISLDGNVLESLMQEHERNLPVTLQGQAARKLQVLLKGADRKMTDDQYLFETKQDELVHQAAARMAQFGWSHDECEFASEMGEESALGWDALHMAPKGSVITQDDYVKAYLAEAVSHEVGHCLGLRHNFAGSTLLSTKQLADDSVTSKEGTSASVMDYTPPNAQAVLKGHGTIFMPTVGTYDEWAIKYGYLQTGAKTPQDERFKLSQVASLSGLPGHGYLTDEEVDQYNPNAVKFDCSSDPLDFSSKQLDELHRARRYAVEELPRPGESYTERSKIILGTIVRSFNEGRIAARFVGGTFGTKNFKGDAHERPTLAPVPAETQRQAMTLLTNDFFQPGNFDLPRDVMESLSMDSEGEDVSGRWNAPLREIVGGLEQNLLSLVMGATTTDRITENAYKAGTHAYTLDEHYDRLMHSVCQEMISGTNSSPLRRDLQRFFVQALILQAGAGQGEIGDDVRLVTTDCLRRLDKVLTGQLASSQKFDNITRLHLQDCHDQIVRFFGRRALDGR
ncbi:MAG TPA: zinc-dependent metalloprotease [Fimbriimonas sp.]|nr:zinc-dependent metalloprotease [Fimbriimonas sp.]